MARTSVAPVLFTVLLSGSPAKGEDVHLVSLSDVAARMHAAEQSAPPSSVTQPPVLAAPLSEGERDELRRRAEVLAKDPRAAGVPAALEGFLGFIGGFAFATLVGLALSAS